MDEQMSFTRTISVVRRHWRTFMVVGVLAVVLSALFSGPRFIKPRYRSQAVVYPVNLNSYSIETRADQLLQLLESNSIRDSIIAKYRLAEHYRMDTTFRGDRNALYNMYKERVTIEKTLYESVNIKVTDEDPVMARDMVMDILDQTNLLARRLQRANSGELLTIIRQGLASTRYRMDSVENRLNQLRQGSGLLDYGTQTKELTKGYMKTIAGNGSKAQKEEIAGMLHALEQSGGEFQRLTHMNYMLIDEFGRKQAEERQALMDVSKELTYTNMVVYPEVSDKKVYPVRWLIVLASTAMALLLCYILIFLRDQLRGAGPAAARD
jgi:capsule polysaccharide export protein KpsE/RkpR